MDTRSRLGVCTLFCLLPALPLAARLAWLQVVLHDQLDRKAHGETLGRDLVVVPRGSILDREGRALAQSVPVTSSYLDFTNVPEPRSAVRRACRILAADPAPLLARLKPGRRFLWLKRKMAPDETDRLRYEVQRDSLAYIGFVSDERRTYPNGDLLKPVLGGVNTDEKGLSGVELAFDRELSGRSYHVRVVKDRMGRAIVQEAPPEQEPPPALRLTIDRTAQHYAETELKAAVTARKAKRGFVVIQDPRSGDILALAVYPPDPLKNPAVQDVYEPGSTFKLVAAAAALEKGLDPQDKVDCENGRWAITPDVTIKDHEPEGLLDLQQILERSSNIGTAKVTLKVGAAAFHKTCRLFGFGYRTGLPLPGESPGLLPGLKELTPVRLANAGFGQGVAVTPIQLAAAFSAIANGGLLLEPRIVRAVGEREAPGPVRVRQVVSAETVASLKAYLEGVVLRGTGAAAKVPGFRVAGKTGTAQKIDPATGRYSPSDYVSSFVGYVPADEPRLTIAVVVDSPRVGYYGSEVACPVFARLARMMLARLGVPPREPLPAHRLATGKGAKA
ncbi:MAG TPA: peptidoglycan glycosyltransferase [Elusimicrobia bacterium]|nr:peptidoglycan glycosyltransferase [Elusimicrobiota bacterium]